MRKLLLFTTCLLFQACYLTPSLDFSRPSVKKLNETNNIPIHNQDCLFEDDILSKNVYRYSQGDLDYFIVDTFSNEEDTFDFLRIPVQPEDYIYEKNPLLDLTNKFAELQIYDDANNTFNKSFYYLSDNCFELLDEKAVDIDCVLDKSIADDINYGFQLETIYKRKSKRRMLRRADNPTHAFYYGTLNNQALLDNYALAVNNHRLNYLLSKPGDNHKYIELDDPITALIPKNAFRIEGENNIYGSEWGYYLTTSRYSSSIIQTEVFLYDIEVLEIDDALRTGMKITPVVNGTYFYNEETDVVYYANDNSFCLYSPQYLMNVSYVDEVDWFFNDYDEREFYVKTKHQPNPGDSDYVSALDEGQCIEYSDFEFLGRRPSQSNDKNIASSFLFAIGKTIDVLQFLNISSVYDLVLDVASRVCSITEKCIETMAKTINNGSGTVDSEKCRFYEKVEQNFVEQYPYAMEDCKNIFYKYPSENLILKTSNDYFKAFDKLYRSSDITKDYRTLLSQRLDMKLGYDYQGLNYITSIQPGVSELRVYGLQTPNMNSISVGKQKHVMLNNEANLFQCYDSHLEPGKYRLMLFNVEQGMKFSPTFRDPFIVSENGSSYPLSLDFSIEQNERVGFSVIKTTKDGKYVSGTFDFILLKIVDDVEFPTDSNKPNALHFDLENTYDPKTITFRCNETSLYSFRVHSDNGGVLFTISDSFGRVIYDSISYAGDGYFVYLLLNSHKRYYINYKTRSSNGALRLNIFKDRYIPKTLCKGETDYRYISNQEKQRTFLFVPDSDHNCLLKSSISGTAIRVYDENLNLLARGSGSLAFNFYQHNFYLIFIDYSCYDYSILKVATLQIKTM